MKNLIKHKVWLLLPLVILGMVTLALAASTITGHGSFDGTVQIAIADPGPVILDIDATGNITHLGKCQLHLHTEADFSTGQPVPIPPSTGTITAANGDTLSFTLRWTTNQLDPGVFDTSGPFTITGGTGRYAGATGGGNYHGIVDLNNQEVSADITGELNR